MATLALHSAGIQQTLETLNHELRDKVEKIAEQRRRILILQEQLRDRAERERDGLIQPGIGPRRCPRKTRETIRSTPSLIRSRVPVRQSGR